MGVYREHDGIHERSGSLEPETLCICISDEEKYYEFEDHIMMLVSKGSTAIFMEPQGAGQPDPNWNFAGKKVTYRRFFEGKYIGGVSEDGDQGLFFVARDAKHATTKEYAPEDFSYWYNSDSDQIDYVAVKHIEGEGLTPLVYSYRKPSFYKWQEGGKEKLPVAAVMSYGQGKAYFISLCLDGRVGFNPVLDSFLHRLL